MGVNEGDSTGVWLSGANDVTISQDTIEGANSDSGIQVINGSTGVIVSHNQIVQSPPATQGVGVGVLANSSTVTLLCNTFSGWKTNIEGAIQVSCTPLPTARRVTPTPQLRWGSRAERPPTSGSSRRLAPPRQASHCLLSGVVSGTPTKTGTFTFPVKIDDSSSPPLSATSVETITVGAGCPTTTSSSRLTSTPTATVAAITKTTIRVTG